jgi:hypothetical protein
LLINITEFCGLSIQKLNSLTNSTFITPTSAFQFAFL